MLVTKKNMLGGRELTKFHIEEENGVWGYKVGYCSCGCNEPLLIRTIDLKDIVDQFGISLEAYNYMKEAFKKFRPRVTVRQRMINFLSKSVDNN